MGTAAVESLSTTTPVYWTRFPARAMQRADWSDPGQGHRSVMRLFPHTLPGPPSERRAGAGILYRVDIVGAEPVVLVQSAVAPELLPAGAKTLELEPTTWRIATGATIMFRVAYCPVVRRSVKGDEQRRIAERGLRVGESPKFLLSRLSTVLDNVEVLDLRRESTKRHRTKNAPPVLTRDVVDAIAIVKDADAFEQLRRHGVGRAKSYGCGLLTARVVS